MSEPFDRSSRIFVAGHRGLVGSAIVRRLRNEGFANVLTAGRETLDLRDQYAVASYFGRERPDLVFLAAARVGGIHANRTFPADFIHDNLAIQTNVIHQAWRHGTKKLVFLGSSCIYPRDCPQPMREENLLSGPLEPTNQWYAIAKIAGIKMCQAYRQQHGFDALCVMPTNLYGPGDNFHPENSHVVPALIRRFSEAARDSLPAVRVWGSGRPLRELMHVDDLAGALLHLARSVTTEHLVNVGSGQEVSIAALATLVADVVGYKGEILFDETQPDGAPRKLLDSSLIRSIGWKAAIDLRSGLAGTHEWYLAQAAAGGIRP